MLQGKKILLGITGGIAAYKSIILARMLVKAGAEVQVILTPDAHHFVTPLTLATLTHKPVLTALYEPSTGVWHNHVALGLWADAMLIAPATANTIAKCCQGISDNLLLTTYLSSKCPVFIAPAMDLDMYAHPSTTKNLQTLLTFGNHIIWPTSGALASGLEGQGRMEEPEVILEVLNDFFTEKKTLMGKKVLITAGPTYEAIDPVRYISNHSSGKMGYALAEAAATAGAEVILVSSIKNIYTIHKNISTITVNTAGEMYEAATSQWPNTDIAIMAAAVADYTPVSPATEKIKKLNTENITLELTPTKDILAEIGKTKKAHQKVIGFALETNNIVENAQKKLKAKNADLIILNQLALDNQVFGADTNAIQFISQNSVSDIIKGTKAYIAKAIIEKIVCS